MPISGPTVDSTSTVIVPENEGRIRQRLYLVNNSNEDMYVSPGALAISTQGIPLKASGGAFSDAPDFTGYMYQGPWTAICVSGGKVISVTELNRRGN